MPAPRKLPHDRAADKAKAVELLADLRQARADLRDAIEALPAPAQRNAGQKRDALIMRTVCLLVQWAVIGAGAASASDLDVAES